MEKIADEITKLIIEKLVREQKGFNKKSFDIKYINKVVAKHLQDQKIK
jgi:hypothetical protein